MTSYIDKFSKKTGRVVSEHIASRLRYCWVIQKACLILYSPYLYHFLSLFSVVLDALFVFVTPHSEMSRGGRAVT